MNTNKYKLSIICRFEHEKTLAVAAKAEQLERKFQVLSENHTFCYITFLLKHFLPHNFFAKTLFAHTILPFLLSDDTHSRKMNSFLQAEFSRLSHRAEEEVNFRKNY